MQARVQSRRTCIILLILTWVFSIAMSSPWLVFLNFDLKYQNCFSELSTLHSRIWDTVFLSLFFFLPLLVMLVLYPVIIVKLRRQKIPGKSNCSQAVIRIRKQNFPLTTMFLTITVAFILCRVAYTIMYLIDLFSMVTDRCTFNKIFNIVRTFPLVFHAIYPMINFIFCPSYRQVIKQLLSCCCRHTQIHHAPSGDQIEL